MRKFISIIALMIGLSASAQYDGLGYYPGFFGNAYMVDGYYVGHTAFKAKLMENPAAYNMWNEGTSNMLTGQIVLYPSAFVFGWGLGSLGWDDTAAVYIGAGGLGMYLGYYLIAQGQEKRESALFHYNQGKSSVSLKPLMNENGGGIAITF